MGLGISVKVDTSAIPGFIDEMKKRNVALRAVRKGIKIVLPIARSMAPKKLGHLKRAQSVKAVKGKKTKTGAYALQGARTKYVKIVPAGSRSKSGTRRVVPAFYDHLVIGGARPHVIRKGSQLGRTQDTYKIRQRATIGQGTGKPHPGTKPNPYRMRAWRSVEEQVQQVVAEQLAVETQKELDKAAAKMQGRK